MRLIYQIGRMDTSPEYKTFVIRDFDGENYNLSYDKKLSSFALRDFLQERGIDSKTVIIYPASILLNNKLLKNLIDTSSDEKIKERLRYVLYNPVEYLKKPQDVIEMIPLEKDRDEKIIIHSLGTYLNDNPIELKCSYDDIVLEILFDLIKRYLNHNIDAIYFDISSGHNIYISAMIEAMRNFSLFVKLKNWICKDKIPKIFIAFSDPILDNQIKSFDIHIQPQVFTAFFSSPIKQDDDLKNFSFLNKIYKKVKNSSLSDDVYEEVKIICQNRKSLREKLEAFVYIFSAIKNNTPLFIYYQKYHSICEIEKEILNLIEYARIQLEKDYLYSPMLDKKTYLSVILSLGFYEGIVDVLTQFDIKEFSPDTGININKIKETFDNIYEIFDISTNKTMFGSEISNLQSKIKKCAQKFEWTNLLKILHPENKPSNCDKRNFFAHSGFESNITDARFDCKDIFLKYNDNFYKELEKIKGYLRGQV